MVVKVGEAKPAARRWPGHGGEEVVGVRMADLNVQGGGRVVDRGTVDLGVGPRVADARVGTAAALPSELGFRVLMVWWLKMVGVDKWRRRKSGPVDEVGSSDGLRSGGLGRRGTGKAEPRWAVGHYGAYGGTSGEGIERSMWSGHSRKMAAV